MNYFLATAGAEQTKTLLIIFAMLAAAKLMAELFERLRQPAVVGEILAGVIIGPSLLNLVAPNEITATLAEIGVIFLLFTVGLETKPQAILQVGKRAFLVAVLGVAVPFAGGWLLMTAWGGSKVEALFLGTAMVATSVGITARVLSDLGVINSQTSRIILGAAVIDDVLGLLILAVVTGVSTGPLNYVSIIVTASLAIGFTVFVLLVGAPVVKRVAPRLENLRVSHSLFLGALIICLGISVAAAYIGVAAIIGAFLAGMAFAEATEDRATMHKQMSGVTEFMVPFFLVNIGMQLKLDVFRDPSVQRLAILVTVIAILTKLIGCGLGAIGLGWNRMGLVGVGMIPRGEVGIVVAQLGLGMALINDSLFGAVLLMAIATTLVAPPFLKLLARNEAAPEKDSLSATLN